MVAQRQMGVMKTSERISRANSLTFMPLLGDHSNDLDEKYDRPVKTGETTDVCGNRSNSFGPIVASLATMKVDQLIQPGGEQNNGQGPQKVGHEHGQAI